MAETQENNEARAADHPSSFGEYSSAREFFAAVRDAAMERDAAVRQLRVLRDSQQPRAVAFGAPRGTRDVNGMGATIALVDFEAVMKKRVADDEALVSQALAVLYGDGDGGAASLLGHVRTDVVYWRFVAAEPWKRAASACGLSVRTAKRHAEEVFDVLDAIGPTRAAAGEGIAAE